MHHDVTRLIDRLLALGASRRATDIHFEPLDAGLLVRFRVDGRLVDAETLPAEIAENVIARLKVLASLLTYRMDIPQEGSLRWSQSGASESSTRANGVDLRVATFPTVRGERAVVRLFDSSDSLPSLESLGLFSDQTERIKSAGAQPSGLIVVAGPAGSGKSTTLYALLHHLAATHPERSIITLEDPVERRIDRVTQIQINPYGELGYERCMRSLLRQDPQVLLIGEIRDARTAEVAIGAALTGHLIFTSMHSGDPAEVVVRLLEMGIAPYQLVSTLRLICAQRLVRKCCTRCSGARRSDCPSCLGTGYSGRLAIAHLVRIDEDARSVILRHPPASELRDHLARQGASLAEAGQRLVSNGVTDAVELACVLGADSESGARSMSRPGGHQS